MKLRAIAIAAAVVVACGSDPVGVVVVAPTDAGPSDAALDDAAATSDAGPPFDQCEGACRETTLTAKFDSGSGALTRAQFGFTKKTGSTTRVIHLEAHDGGSAACPTESSPTTDRTLVVEDVPIPQDGSTLDAGDGLRAAFFDFKGDVMGSGVLAKATSVSLTPTAIVKEGGEVVAFAATFDASFPQEGKVSGKLFAEHCATMDE